MPRRNQRRPRQPNRRPLLTAGNVAVAAAMSLVALGVWGVAPWAGFGSQYGGVGTIAALGAATAALSLLGVVVRRERRPFTALSALGVLACSLVLLAVFPPKWLLSLLNDPAGPVFYFDTSEPLVALTIDDGLDPDTTPAILDTLAKHNAHATFFVLSDTLAENRELVRRVLDEGHELANHQTRDVPLVSLEPGDAADEIVRADAALREFAEPRWFRPGGGVATDAAIAVARRRGCTCVLGSVFPFDSHLAWPPFVAAYIGERPVGGDIVVLHDGADRGRRTVAALRAALPRLAERGLRCVTLAELARAR